MVVDTQIFHWQKPKEFFIIITVNIVLLILLAKHDLTKDMSIKDISLVQTGIKTEDIISTSLKYLEFIKCWKGQHVIFVRQDTFDDYTK
jgi:hypothetical protein